MKLLSKYILRQHVGPFLFSIGIVTFIFLLNLIFQDFGRILSRGLKLTVILEFLALNLAWIIALAVPMSVLVATLSTFGRLSADNEITAIKSSGINFFQILLPILIAASILTVIMIEFNDKILPDLNHRARLLSRDIFRKRPTLKLEPKVVFSDLPHMNILVQEIEEKGDSANIRGVVIDERNNSRLSKTILAKSGVIKFDFNSERLIMTLYDGEIHEIDTENFSNYRWMQFEKYKIAVNIPDLTLKRSKAGSRGDREKTIKMMQADIQNHRRAMQRQKQVLATVITNAFKETFPATLLKSASLDASGNVPVDIQTIHLSRGQLSSLINKLERTLHQIQMGQQALANYDKSIHSLQVEIHKKYSIPAACIVFVLIGAPLGIKTRKGNLGISSGISLLFFVLYWVSLIGGEELADRRLISPFLAMWGANILVGTAGICLAYYTITERSLLHWLVILPKRWFKKQKRLQ
ncbi:YjgP/YjgQ family permease [candidate division KSB1 bacterium]|nr:MAG: YjgP/YjgQ family permease [candidate division KSB1 bacterium]